MHKKEKKFLVVFGIFVLIIMTVCTGYIASYDQHLYQFTKSIKISNNTSIHPSIGVHITGGRISIVWVEYDEHNAYICHSTSTNGGASFTPTQIINDKPLTVNTLKSAPWVSIDSGTVEAIYVVWSDDRNGHNEIFFAKCTTGIGETTFRNNLKVNDEFTIANHIAPTLSPSVGGTLYGCGVGCEGTNLGVVWYDNRRGNYDIWFADSTNGGDVFMKNVMVNDDNTTVDQINPKSVIDGNEDFHVVWTDMRDGNYDIYYSKGAEMGRKFSTNRRLNDDNGAAVQNNATIGVDTSDNLYVLWEDYRSGNADIYFTKSIDKGKTFMKNRKLVGDKNDQLNPSIFITYSNRIYVTWFDSYDKNIHYIISADGGATFSAPMTITTEPVMNGEYSIAVDNEGHMYAVWICDNVVKFTTTTNTPKLFTNVKVSNTHITKGDKIEIHVEALNLSLRPAEGAEVIIEPESGGDYFARIEGWTNGQGIFDCVVTPKKTGTFNISVTVSYGVLCDIHIIKIICSESNHIIEIVTIGIVCIVVCVVFISFKVRGRRKGKNKQNKPNQNKPNKTNKKMK